MTTELQSLEAELSALIATRNAARDAYDEANREFDRLAVPLQRQITKLRAAESNGGRRGGRKRKGRGGVVVEPVGLSDDEREHFLRVQAAVRDVRVT